MKNGREAILSNMNVKGKKDHVVNNSKTETNKDTEFYKLNF